MKRILQKLALLLIALLTIFAAVSISGCTKSTSPQVIEHYNKGVDMMNTGQYDAAIAEYSQALGIDQNYANAWVNRGYCYYMKKQYPMAIADYSQGINLNPKDTYAYNGRGASYMNLKQYENALEDFNQAIKLDPNFTKAIENRDYVLKMLGSSVTVSTTDTRTRTNKTGKIDTGASVEVVKNVIGTSGGMIKVGENGGPLNGFQIDVPAGSYSDSRTFKVSYAPVTNQTFGKDLNFISPLITVDNGGGYSEQIMYVKIPVQIPDGHFAMGFYYDEKTGELEGMPLVSEDKNSITIATRHFTNFIASSIDKYRLEGAPVISGFLPGFDDWQFPNNGSYLAPDGHCTGMSITAMWYYHEKFLKGEKALYDRYNNNTSIWQDDVYAYRLASVVQKDYESQINGLVYQGMLNYSASLNDNQQLEACAYAILATGRPQFVGVLNTAGHFGHAIICYEVRDRNIKIADPNKPGDKNSATYWDAQNRLMYNNGENYDRVLYFAESSIIPPSKIATYWSEMEDKTIGSKEFPKYKLLAVDGSSTRELTDGFTTNNKTLNIEVSGDMVLGTAIYQNNKWATDNNGNIKMETSSQVTLAPGKNKLGIWVVARMVGANAQAEWDWLDFQWITVNYRSSTPELSLDNASVASASMTVSWVPSSLATSQGDGSYQWKASVTIDLGGITLPKGAWLILIPGNFTDVKDKYLFSNPTWGFPNIETQSAEPVNKITFDLTAVKTYLQKDRPPIPELTLSGLTIVVQPYGRPPIPPEKDIYRDFNIVLKAVNN